MYRLGGIQKSVAQMKGTSAHAMLFLIFGNCPFKTVTYFCIIHSFEGALIPRRSSSGNARGYCSRKAQMAKSHFANGRRCSSLGSLAQAHYLYLHVYVYIYIYMCMCMCIYIKYPLGHTCCFEPPYPGDQAPSA